MGVGTSGSRAGCPLPARPADQPLLPSGPRLAPLLPLVRRRRSSPAGQARAALAAPPVHGPLQPAQRQRPGGKQPTGRMLAYFKTCLMAGLPARLCLLACSLASLHLCMPLSSPCLLTDLRTAPAPAPPILAKNRPCAPGVPSASWSACGWQGAGTSGTDSLWPPCPASPHWMSPGAPASPPTGYGSSSFWFPWPRGLGWVGLGPRGGGAAGIQTWHLPVVGCGLQRRGAQQSHEHTRLHISYCMHACMHAPNNTLSQTAPQLLELGPRLVAADLKGCDLVGDALCAGGHSARRRLTMCRRTGACW